MYLRVALCVFSCCVLVACPGPLEPGGRDGGCVDLPAPTPATWSPTCTTLPPGNGQSIGGTISPGRYLLTGALLGSGYLEADGGCRDSLGQMGFVLQLSATADAGVFAYQAAAVSPAVGASRGTMVVSPDGQSVGFGEQSCVSGVAPSLPPVAQPRLFKATDSSFAFDCCRSSVAGAGDAIGSTSSYMLVFSRQ